MDLVQEAQKRVGVLGAHFKQMIKIVANLDEDMQCLHEEYARCQGMGQKKIVYDRMQHFKALALEDAHRINEIQELFKELLHDH